MLDVNMAPAVSCVMLFQQAPQTVRQMCQDANACGTELEHVTAPLTPRPCTRLASALSSCHPICRIARKTCHLLPPGRSQ